MKFEHQPQFFSMIAAETFYKNHEYVTGKKILRQILKFSGENDNWIIYFLFLRLSLIYNNLNFGEKSKSFLQKSLELKLILKTGAFEKSIVDFNAFIKQTKNAFLNELYLIENNQSIKNFNFQEFEKDTLKFYQILETTTIQEKNLEDSTIEISKIYDFLDQKFKIQNLVEINFREALNKI